MVINFVMVNKISSVLDHGSATKINDSGRMRLYSQRIRSFAFEIDTAVRNADWAQLEPLYNDLNESTTTLETLHDRLFTGGTPETLFPDASTEELDQIASIAVPYNRLLTASNDLQLLTRNSIRRAPYLDPQTKDRISTNMSEIRDAQSIFLPRMESMVALFERRSRTEIDASTAQARAGLIVLAVLLGAMVLFIIEPTILIIRKQLQELDRATRQARKADSVRWRLLTNMGHEFRTPMNAVLGFTSLLNEDTLTEAERDRLTNSIHESAQHLASLIETMLDMSAIESGQLRVYNSKCTLSEIITPCIEQATTEALTKGITLKSNLDQSCNRSICTDAKRLPQIVEKLLDNAIKFTEKGTISVDARISDHPTNPSIIFTITDTGIGIEEDELGRIFEAFHQAQNTLTREYGGSGLGLSFARDLARAMNGDITVSSTPGQGACFTLRIDTDPMPEDQQRTSQAAQPTSHALALGGARILIVDDAKDNRVLLQHFFKNTQAHTEFAYDGQQAIGRITQAHEQGEPFDLVLMDMQMPVLDGYSATRQLRQAGFTTPIIALTAHALDGDREQCIEAGCTEYLTKPINKAALIKTCAQLIAAGHPPMEQAA